MVGEACFFGPDGVRGLIKELLTFTIDFPFLCKPIWWNATVSRFPLNWYHLAERRSPKIFGEGRSPSTTCTTEGGSKQRGCTVTFWNNYQQIWPIIGNMLPHMYGVFGVGRGDGPLSSMRSGQHSPGKFFEILYPNMHILHVLDFCFSHCSGEGIIPLVRKIGGPITSPGFKACEHGLVFWATR